VPGSTSCLREVAIRYFFVDSHAIVVCGSPAGLRRVRTHLLRHRVPPSPDTESSDSVEPKHGYPVTRTTAISTATSAFTPLDYIGPHSTRKGTGCTPASSTTHHARQAARQWSTTRTPRGKAGLHASHSRATWKTQARSGRGMDRRLSSSAPTTPSCTGTGGNEGPIFLSDLYRQLHLRPKASSSPSHPASTWTGHPTNQLATRALALGTQGYGEQWVNESNAWTWRHIHAPASAWWNWPPAPGRDPPTRSPCGRSKQARRELIWRRPATDVHHGHRHHGAVCHAQIQRAHRPFTGFTKT